MAYQQRGTTNSKASPADISQESQLYFNSHLDGKNSGFNIFEKWWESRIRKRINKSGKY